MSDPNCCRCAAGGGKNHEYVESVCTPPPQPSEPCPGDNEGRPHRWEPANPEHTMESCAYCDREREPQPSEQEKGSVHPSRQCALNGNHSGPCVYRDDQAALARGECENCARLERELADTDAERNVAQAHSALVEEMLFKAGYVYQGEMFHEFVKRAWDEQCQRAEQAEAALEKANERVRRLREALEEIVQHHADFPREGWTRFEMKTDKIARRALSDEGGE